MKFKITVLPKSKKPRVEKNSNDKLHVYIGQAPEKGKANRAVIEALAKYFKVSKSQVNIVFGLKSKSFSPVSCRS